MDAALKATALQVLNKEISKTCRFELDERLRVGVFSTDPDIKQGLTLIEVRDEIQKGSKTGEIWARVFGIGDFLGYTT